MRPDTVFRIASLTKSFTGLLGAALQQKGIVRLDAPIGDYVAGLSPRIATLTLSNLLSHTSGLRDEAATYGPHDARALEDAARRITDQDLFTTPGDIYSYSNIGFTLAGFVMETAAGKPYAELVETEILRPLGMTTSTFDATMAMTYPLAIGHAPAPAGGTVPVVIRPFWDNAEALPRGGMFSTGPELARFAVAIMNGGFIDGAQAIPTDVVSLATQPHARAPGTRKPLEYGYGFRIDRYRGFRQVSHFGGGMGFGAVFRTLPERRIAVVVLVNRTNALLNDVADAALDAMIGTASESAPEPTPGDLAPLNAEDARALAGRYRNGEQEIVLVLRGSELFMQDDAEFFAIKRSDDELTAIDADGKPILDFVAVTRTKSNNAYLFLLGRAFRRTG